MTKTKPSDTTTAVKKGKKVRGERQTPETLGFTSVMQVSPTGRRRMVKVPFKKA